MKPQSKELLKSVYNLIPFKKAAFTLLKSVYSPPHSVFQHLTFKDKFRVKIDSKSSFLINHYGFYVENDVFWKGVTGHETLSIALWIELSKDAQVILDIGANTGIYSLISKSVNPQSNVYAFEPIIRVYEKLCDNIRLNNYRVKTIRKALSNNDGSATVYDPGSEHIYSVTVNHNLNNETVAVEPVEIETQRLDTFFQSENLQRADLIKIDVETHEAEVLEGFGEYLGKFEPMMLIEILTDEVGANVQKILDKHNYVYFHINETNKTLDHHDKIIRHDGDLNFLCVPKHKVMFIQKIYAVCVQSEYWQ